MKVKASLAMKLVAWSAVVLVVTAVVGWVGIRAAGKGIEVVEETLDRSVGSMVDLAALGLAVLDVRPLVLEHIGADPAEERRIEGELSKVDSDIASRLDRLAGRGLPVDTVAAAWADYREARDRDTISLSREQRDEEALTDFATAGRLRFQAVTDAVDDLTEFVRRDAARALNTARSDVRGQRSLALALVVGGIVLAASLSLSLARRTSRRVTQVSVAAQELAGGELQRRAPVTGTDEIAVLASGFNTMADRLQALIEGERETRRTLQAAVAEYSALASRVAEGDLSGQLDFSDDGELSVLAGNLNGMVGGLRSLSVQVREAAQSIGSATAEILASVSQHTASASQQSAAISETTTTVNELRVASEQTAEKAREVAKQGQASVEASNEGTRVVETIIEAMRGIAERVEGVSQDILSLSEQAEQVGGIITTVNDIADQSNLLALNAAIEAAKAGEHGKGFAVVATEIRNLAEQSKQATGQVRTVLGDIQRATNAAVMTTERGTVAANEGIDLARRAGEVINQLSSTIRAHAQSAQQIVASAAQQSAGIDQIAHAMEDVNQGTAQFVAGAQQSQAAAENLTALSSHMLGLVEAYRA